MFAPSCMALSGQDKNRDIYKQRLEVSNNGIQNSPDISVKEFAAWIILRYQNERNP